VRLFQSFWGSLVMLIALMIVLERAGGVSKILGAGGKFVGTTVHAFK
jgi:hypothetical protein